MPFRRQLRSDARVEELADAILVRLMGVAQENRGPWQKNAKLSVRVDGRNGPELQGFLAKLESRLRAECGAQCPEFASIQISHSVDGFEDRRGHSGGVLSLLALTPNQPDKDYGFFDDPGRGEGERKGHLGTIELPPARFHTTKGWVGLQS